MTQLPKFTAALLHPRYWLTWSGIGLLWLIVQLPYPVIFRMGKGLGRIAQQFMKRRARIAYRNLELCFPQMSESERHDMVVKNFESVGMGLMETGMAWFWSDKRMARWTEVAGTGMEPVHTLQANQTGVLLIGVHFLTLEIGARMFGMQALLVYNSTNQIAGRIFSYNQSFRDLGNVTGPLVGAGISASFGFRAVFIVTAGVVLFNAVYSWLSLSRALRPGRIRQHRDG